jgi:hypothetical protein
MLAPPNVEMRNPAAANGRATRKSDFISPQDSTETAPEFQARSLRQPFALGQNLAVTVAQLAWGALPR